MTKYVWVCRKRMLVTIMLTVVGVRAHAGAQLWITNPDAPITEYAVLFYKSCLYTSVGHLFSVQLYSRVSALDTSLIFKKHSVVKPVWLSRSALETVNCNRLIPHFSWIFFCFSVGGSLQFCFSEKREVETSYFQIKDVAQINTNFDIFR